MNPLVAPPLGPLAEERAVGRPPERRTPPPAHQPRADIVVDRDEVPCGGRTGDNPPDLGREIRGNPLVGIDFENPIAATDVDPGMATRSFPFPGTFDEPPGESVGDLAGPISAAIEDDDDLVGKGQTSEAFGQLALLVVDNDKGGEAGSALSIHAAALATERHKRQAAASAASTERPSISVSVVR